MRHLTIISLFLALTAFGCQKAFVVDGGAGAVVTYTIVPEISFDLKSGAEGTTVATNRELNSLSYMVYHKKIDANGQTYYDYIEEMGAYVTIDNPSNIPVPVTLIKGQEYRLVFVAQHRFESQQRTISYAYSVSEEGMMSVNTSAPFTNGDQLEAFVYVDEVGPITGNETRNIRLNRIVSQLNIGTNATTVPSTVDLEVSGTPTSYDIFNNRYSPETSTLAFTNFKTKGDNLTVSGTDHTRLTTLYLLGGNRIDLTISYNGNTKTISNIATAPNFKTNVVGKI